MANPDNSSEELLREVGRIVEAEFAAERYLSFVYGSYAYGTQHHGSDLDILMIGESADLRRVNRMAAAVQALHRQRGMVLDEEVPYDRKLVATWDDLKAAIVGAGFHRKSGRLVATPITKTGAFLESEEIRLRLLLNAITGRCLFVAGDAEALKTFQSQARVNWVRILALLLDKRCFSVSSFVDELIGSGDRKGEWFLGFPDDPIRRAYLEEEFSKVFSECVRRRWIRKSQGLYEVIDDNWMRELMSIP